MFRVSINKSIFLIFANRMDWDRYYQDKINKYNDNILNKVSNFTGNQTGCFIRSFGTFFWEQYAKLRKWLHPEDYQRAVDENYQRVKEENKEKRKKLVERRKKISELYGEGQERGFFNPFSGVQKLSQQVSNLIADETKNKTIEKFIDNQNEKVKNEMIKVKDSVKNA